MFTLENVVPWGRSCEEYERMFALSAADLRRRIVGCADGPAAFNAVATRRGTEVVSVDPVYRWSAQKIASRIAVTRETVLEQARANASGFRWERIPSVEALGDERGTAMDLFLADYESGRSQGGMSTRRCPTCPFRTIRSTWRCVHISCSCTRTSTTSRFTRVHSSSCAGSPRRCVCFPCSPLAVSLRPSWTRSPRSATTGDGR